MKSIKEKINEWAKITCKYCIDDDNISISVGYKMVKICDVKTGQQTVEREFPNGNFDIKISMALAYAKLRNLIILPELLFVNEITNLQNLMVGDRFYFLSDSSKKQYKFLGTDYFEKEFLVQNSVGKLRGYPKEKKTEVIRF